MPKYVWVSTLSYNIRLIDRSVGRSGDVPFLDSRTGTVSENVLSVRKGGWSVK